MDDLIPWEYANEQSIPKKIYLETTVFYYYFDEGNDYQPATIKLFYEITEGLYKPYTSVLVLRELDKAPDDKRQKMLNLITEFNIKVLDINDDATSLAELYIEKSDRPIEYLIDATHIALSAVNNLDILISFSYQYIIYFKVKEWTKEINKMNNYHPVEIWMPMQVINYDET